MAKCGHLLKDDDVKGWHDNLVASSRITAVHQRTLGLSQVVKGWSEAKATFSGGPLLSSHQALKSIILTTHGTTDMRAPIVAVKGSCTFLGPAAETSE